MDERVVSEYVSFCALQPQLLRSTPSSVVLGSEDELYNVALAINQSSLTSGERKGGKRVSEGVNGRKGEEILCLN